MFTFQYIGINLIKHIITSFIEVYLLYINKNNM